MKSRDYTLRFRVTEVEYDRFHEAAYAEGDTFSNWARRALARIVLESEAEAAAASQCEP